MDRMTESAGRRLCVDRLTKPADDPGHGARKTLYAIDRALGTEKPATLLEQGVIASLGVV